MSSSRKGKGRIGPFVVTTLIGVVVGLASILLYAYGTAEWWITGRVAGYVALALVPTATALAAGMTALAVGRMASAGRLQTSGPVLVAGLVVFALAAVVRVYPVPELTFQLPTYLDATPGLSRALDDLKNAQLPLLGASMGPTFALIYMVVEALVLFGVLVLIARLAITAPYCYSCGTYCQRRADVARVNMATTAAVLENINLRNWMFFRGLGVPAPDSEQWLRLDVAQCPNCQRTSTLSVQMMDKGGRRSQGLVHDLKITQDDLRTVERLNG